MKASFSGDRGRLKEIRAADYIRKLRMLEERIGATTQYRILKPFPCNPRDPIDLQKAAKRIGSFVGIEDLTFNVAVARQKENVGGHIELEDGQEFVFIEISPRAGRSPQATLAVLAHEICHKLLQRQGISLGYGLLEDYENEILTDITSVFVGLGKLMLNGAETQSATWKERGQAMEGLRTGYLNRRQLAFVYRLVCAMRSVGKREMRSGLALRARSEVRHWARFKSQFFDPAFRERENRRNQVRDLQPRVIQVEEKLQQLRRQGGPVERDLFAASKAFVTEAERDLRALRERMGEILATEIHDPSLRFLDAMDVAAGMRTAHSRLTDLAGRAEQWIAKLDRALRKAESQS